MKAIIGEAGGESPAIDAIVGESRWVKETRNQIRDVASSNLGILVSGPTGTGKELIARAVHGLSSRASKPFIAVDCASAIGDIFSSHLFGQIQGAFTGAVTSLGCFRAAEGGTLFLDEIGELTQQMQAQLLRVLEDKTIVPVGAVNAIPVDVRVIAATNRDLLEEIRFGGFRRDLYHRLNMIELKTTGLKERPVDIEILARHFIAASCRENDLPETILDSDAVKALSDYDWPGNVRELRNVIERVMLANSGKELTRKSFALLQSLTTNHHPSLPQTSTALRVVDKPMEAPTAHTSADILSSVKNASHGRKPWVSLDELERYHIQQTLEHTFYNQTAAANLLGITRRVLHRLIKKHGLNASEACGGLGNSDTNSNWTNKKARCMV